MPFIAGSRRRWQTDRDDRAGRAVARQVGTRTARLDPAAHRLDQAARDRQAQPGPGRDPVATAGPEEAVEHVRQIVRRDADALVGDGKQTS